MKKQSRDPVPLSKTLSNSKQSSQDSCNNNKYKLASEAFLLPFAHSGSAKFIKNNFMDALVYI
jgi:hypothetical protein